MRLLGFVRLCLLFVVAQHAVAVEKEYDFVIVGGGLSGLVVANRLSEVVRESVLVIEAGVDPTNDARISTPAFVAQQKGSSLDWSFATTPQKMLNSAELHFQQGKMLGGSSGANYMAYCRGASSVYDEWALIGGESRWAWQHFREMFARSTRLASTSTDVRLGETHPEVYGGANGKVQIMYPKKQYNFGPYMHDAFLTSKHPLQDVNRNTGQGIGVSYTTFSISPTNASRSSSFTAYGQEAMARPNVEITTETTVTKINLSKEKVAESVTIRDKEGKRRRIKAKKEIILAAGSFNTPKLLLLSGIGPKKDLQHHGISVLVDSPRVGKEMQDHFFSVIVAEVRPEIVTSANFSDASFFQRAMQVYQDNAEGPLAVSLASTFANDRVSVDGEDGSFEKYGDRPTSQYDAVVAPVLPEFLNQTQRPLISFAVANVQPQGRGQVTLRSADVDDKPLIDSNIFGTEYDWRTIVAGYKRLRRLLQEPTMQKMIVKEVLPDKKVQSDEQIEQTIRKATELYHHPVGTASMGAVVDGQLRVKGARRLRIVDASVQPRIPTCYIQASVYAVAEQASAMIKEEWTLAEPSAMHGGSDSIHVEL